MFAGTRVLLLEIRSSADSGTIGVMMPAGRGNRNLPCSTFQLDGLYSIKYWSGIRNDLEESYLRLFSSTIPAFPRVEEEKS
jgi:hypothetical protein